MLELHVSTVRRYAWARGTIEMLATGAFWFGLVIGYITYRTLHHKKEASTADIAAVIGAIGGAAVVKLFPMQDDRFDYYAYGLAIGFFAYLLISVVLSLRVGEERTKKMLGEDTVTLNQPGGSTAATRRFGE